MTTSTKPLHEERIEEPAKAWRNWGRVLLAGWDEDETVRYEPGDIVRSDEIYPSKEVAEQKCAEILEWNVQHNGHPAIEYLGAFPEGQRP